MWPCLLRLVPDKIIELALESFDLGSGLRREGQVVGLHRVIVAVIQLFAAIAVPDVTGMAHKQRFHRTPKGGRATVVRIPLRAVVDLGEDR